MAAIQRLKAAVEANFKRIDTWQGTFAFSETTTMRGGQFGETLAAQHNLDLPAELSSAGQIEFVVDNTRESYWTAFQPSGPIVAKNLAQPIQPESRIVPDPQVVETIVTPADYLHFRPKRLYRQLLDYRTLQAAIGKGTKVAFRDPVAKRGGSNASDQVDPRGFFAHFHNARPIWEALEGDMRDALELRAVPPAADRPSIDVIEVRSGDEAIYKIRHTIPRPDLTIVLEKTFSSQAGLNLVEYQEMLDRNGDIESTKSRRIVYDRRGEIFIPQWINDVNGSDKNSATFHRNYNLVSYRLNDRVPHDTFTVAKFDLKQGDRFLDRIEKKLFFQDGGKFIEAPKLEPTTRSRSAMRLAIFAINALLIVGLLVTLVLRMLRAHFGHSA
jgi:hypothetical protein